VEANRYGVEAEGLRKQFRDTTALDGLDLRVGQGTVCGLLGPNGAGKTTAIRVLATLVRPDGGTARVAGHDVVREAAEVRRHVGLTGQTSTMDEILTGRENLAMWGRLWHLGRAEARARADQLLEQFGRADAAAKQVKHYSGGMRRRLDLAAGFIQTPSVLFLDEPTTGLDPRNRNEVWAAIRKLSAEGTTVLLCTQYLDEADQLASQIAVLDHGKLVAQGTPEQLKRLVPGGHIRLRFTAPEEFALAGQVLPSAARDEEALVLQVPSDGSVHTLRSLLARIDDASLEVDELTVHTPDLDDVFFAVTGQPTTHENAEEKVTSK
jgi:ABC-2 type transport system ATP-binding protein